MKSLDEYFLMVVFTLLLNRVHIFANFKFEQRNMAVKVKVPQCTAHIQLIRSVHTGGLGALLTWKVHATLFCVSDNFFSHWLSDQCKYK